MDFRTSKNPMERRFEKKDRRVTVGQSRPQIPHGEEVREVRLESHRGTIEASDTPWSLSNLLVSEGVKPMETRFDRNLFSMGYLSIQIPHGEEVRE